MVCRRVALRAPSRSAAQEGVRLREAGMTQDSAGGGDRATRLRRNGKASSTEPGLAAQPLRFYIYWNKNRLQGATDAAALAGATYFNGVTFAGKNPLCLYATDAQNAACTHALNNGILQSELATVVADSSNQSMTVRATR